MSTSGELFLYFFAFATEVIVLGGGGFALGFWVRGKLDEPQSKR